MGRREVVGSWMMEEKARTVQWLVYRRVLITEYIYLGSDQKQQDMVGSELMWKIYSSVPYWVTVGNWVNGSQESVLTLMG